MAADAATAAALAAGDRVMSPELLCQKDLRSPSTTLRAASNSNNGTSIPPGSNKHRHTLLTTFAHNVEQDLT